MKNWSLILINVEPILLSLSQKAVSQENIMGTKSYTHYKYEIILLLMGNIYETLQQIIFNSVT